MKLNYRTEGRDACLAELKNWLVETFPPSNIVQHAYSTNVGRAKNVENIIKKSVSRARIGLKWRKSLSDTLRIHDDDVLKATNTIMELIERELAKGGTVRLKNFGSLKTVAFKEGQRVQFDADEDWKRLLNEPLYDSEIGLKKKLVKKRLTRRV